jgi:hypothetical protein
MGKDENGNGSDLIKILSVNLSRENEENHA